MPNKTAKCDWVFWVSIKIRRNWFSYYWSTRGANYKDYQIFIFHISIGMPWIEDVFRQHSKQYIDKTNSDNNLNSFSILIKRK